MFFICEDEDRWMYHAYVMRELNSKYMTNKLKFFLETLLVEKNKYTQYILLTSPENTVIRVLMLKKKKTELNKYVGPSLTSINRVLHLCIRDELECVALPFFVVSRTLCERCWE